MKIVDWIKKYKAEIIIALGAISSIAASIATMDANAAVCASIIIAVVAILVELLKNGVTEQAITLISKAIIIIIEELKKDKEQPVAFSSREVVSNELTLDSIKKRLLEK